jgi:hypothetical protein
MLLSGLLVFRPRMDANWRRLGRLAKRNGFVPKGQKMLAQGFNPGFAVPSKYALKASSTPRMRGAILIWRITPSLHDSIAPFEQNRGRRQPARHSFSGCGRSLPWVATSGRRVRGSKRLTSGVRRRSVFDHGVPVPPKSDRVPFQGTSRRNVKPRVKTLG